MFSPKVVAEKQIRAISQSVTPSHFDPRDELMLAFRPGEPSRYRHFTRGVHRFKNSHVTIVVPEGTRSDLASIPSFLRVFFSPTGRWQRAAVFHDQLCDAANNWAERLFADSMFYSLCRLDGCGPVVSHFLYLGVRLGAYGWAFKKGLLSWNK